MGLMDRGKKAINKKTAFLIVVEHKPPKQAYAMANSMKRAGRLTPGGDYIPAKKKK